ncbi:OmpA family protein [Pontibacter arcticus]|uniref:OmpA-like domain-containing protein n=1 Tax=Pontibacter arcticus TaxID=2080288 RepID=A0A364RFW6_9BACT|nr:OmpA family protein [Pontibacter arcticus]RAU83056.1 hypothetical protein DP923_07440 [Pontibacter arcticus]
MLYRSLLLWVALLLSTAAFAQQNSLSTKSKKAESLYHKADEYTRARDFDRALEVLDEALAKDPAFGEAYLRAANLNKILGRNSVAQSQLEKGLALLPYSAAYTNFYFDLAELSFDKGNYEQAKANYQSFLKGKAKNTKQIEWANRQLKTIEYALVAIQKPVNFSPSLLPATINKFGLQYFPYTTADQRSFIYTARAGINPTQDENIFISKKKGEDWQNPVSISEVINTSANEGAATISGDGRTLVFASCNRPDTQGDCDLYISLKTGEEWSKPVNMGTTVNSKAWDSQPSLSADGRTLYFTSTRGGGVGKEDIWVTYMAADGIWLKPENLGRNVNTTARDMAPSIHSSGSTLYFVSDGHLGFGGLDVFKTTRTKGKNWSEPANMGYPLNTFADEGSLFISPDNKKGFYSRQVGSDMATASIQLYSFDVPAEWRSLENSTYAQGRVFDEATKKPLGAVVQLYDVASDSLIQQVSSDKVSGEYTVVLTEGKQYALYVSAPKYLVNSLSFDYTSAKALTPVALDVYLKPVKSGAAVVLSNLFFDTNKYKLDPKSKTELDKLISFIKQNQSIKLEISGHTDDVGSDQANLELSSKRAQAVVDYLVSQGVPKNLIVSKGYGESKPVKPNTSEENRQLNRRIEMRVL